MLMDLIDIDWSTVFSHLILLAVAFVLAVPIGWNREVSNRPAGLRTFPLVAVATCGFMLVGIEVLDNVEARGRVLAGIITGMGFIGGGAILKNNNTVSGTATATSLWGTGAVGIAVAWQRYEIAIVLSLLTFLTLQFVPAVQDVVDEQVDNNED